MHVCLLCLILARRLDPPPTSSYRSVRRLFSHVFGCVAQSRCPLCGGSFEPSAFELSRCDRRIEAMLRAALASLLALASVWVGPVARPIDVYNDTS